MGAFQGEEASAKQPQDIKCMRLASFNLILVMLFCLAISSGRAQDVYVDCSLAHDHYSAAMEQAMLAYQEPDRAKAMRFIEKAYSDLAYKDAPLYIFVKSSCDSETYYDAEFVSALLNYLNSDGTELDAQLFLESLEALESRVGIQPHLSDELFRKMVAADLSSYQKLHVRLPRQRDHDFLQRWSPNAATIPEVLETSEP